MPPATALQDFFQVDKIVGEDEDLPVQIHHDVYATIDPAPHFASQTFAGKVVLVTGASQGIGHAIALHFARAGASVALVARTASTLASTKADILREVPEARVLTFVVDVKDPQKAKEAVEATVEKFGRLDVLVPNAGVSTAFAPLEEKDSNGWWNTFEVNVLGVFNFVRPALEHLKETKGYVIATGGQGAQLRLPGGSDYSISKHALGRLIEFIVLEYPEVKAFAVHPGHIKTQMAADVVGVDESIDVDLPVALACTTRLPACTALYLAAGNADWLSGRYMSAMWDLGEVEREWKTKIVEGGALVNKLHVPPA